MALQQAILNTFGGWSICSADDWFSGAFFPLEFRDTNIRKKVQRIENIAKPQRKFIPERIVKIIFFIFDSRKFYFRIAYNPVIFT
jgi:hypothetical protein